MAALGQNRAWADASAMSAHKNSHFRERLSAPKGVVRTKPAVIAALFRKGSPISGDAEPAPPVDRPIAQEAASEIVSERAGEEANATRVDDKPTLASQGAMVEQTSSPLAGLDLDTAIRTPLGATRYQSQANEIDGRQSK